MVVVYLVCVYFFSILCVSWAHQKYVSKSASYLKYMYAMHTIQNRYSLTHLLAHRENWGGVHQADALCVFLNDAVNFFFIFILIRIWIKTQLSRFKFILSCIHLGAKFFFYRNKKENEASHGYDIHMRTFMERNGEREKKLKKKWKKSILNTFLSN